MPMNNDLGRHSPGNLSTEAPAKADGDCPSCGDHTFPRAMHLTEAQASEAGRLLDSVEVRPYRPEQDSGFATAPGGELEAGMELPAEFAEQPSEGFLIHPPPPLENRAAQLDMPALSEEVPPHMEALPSEEQLPHVEAPPTPSLHYMNECPSVEGDSVGSQAHSLSGGHVGGLSGFIGPFGQATPNPNQQHHGQLQATSSRLVRPAVLPFLGARNPAIFGVLDKSTAKVSCDGYAFNWHFALADVTLHAAGYRVFQLVSILQTFECCDPYRVHLIYGYLEVFSAFAGPDLQQTKGITKDAHAVCFHDTQRRCPQDNHGGPTRVTESRIVKTFLARPSAAGWRGLNAASTPRSQGTAYVDLAREMQGAAVGQHGNPDCFHYHATMPASNFVRVGWTPSDIMVQHSALPGSERDMAITFEAEFDCSSGAPSRRPCQQAELGVTSRLDPGFRMTELFP